MKIVIIGGGGMVGQKLAHKLAISGKLGNREIAELTLADAFAGHVAALPVMCPDAPLQWSVIPQQLHPLLTHLSTSV